MENEIKTVVPTLRFPEFQNTEGWKEYKLKSLCEIGNGKDYKHLGSGNIPVYGSGGYMTSVDDFLYDGESVCIGRKGTIDKPIFLTGKFWTVDTLFYTHSFHNCLPKFLYLIFQHINWYKYNEAGGVPSLSKTTIGEINVFVPVGEKGELKEQQKIVNCIFSLDELIEATAQKVEALKEHKKGLMQRLFPAEGKNVPDLRFPEFQRAQVWEEKKLGEKGVFYGGGTPDRSNSSYWTGNIGWISSSDLMEDNIHHIAITRFINEKAINKSATKIIPKECVLFVSRVGVGKIAVNKEELCTSQDFTNFQPTKGLSSYFVGYYFLSKKKYLKSHNQGTSIKGFSRNDIEKTTIVYPFDIKEQQKIADCFSSLDELLEATSRKVEILKEHKKGLMQQLFPKI